jgi:hypothetical protein
MFRLRNDYVKPGSPFASVGVPRIGVRIPSPFLQSGTPVEDDPATLARLAAIMSDRVLPCPKCGADPHICRAIGCDTVAVRPA